MTALRFPATFAAYALKAFIPVFLVSSAFFVLILEMADIFLHLVQYLPNGVPAGAIARMALLYLPKCLSWSVPIAVLFAASYSLGSLYARNELLAVFASGTSLLSFTVPLLVLALALSAGYLAFEDGVVVPSSAAKSELSRTVMRTGQPEGIQTDRTILGDAGRLVWSARYFDPQSETLAGLTVVERDDGGGFVSRLEAESASWDGSAWVFSGVRRYYWKDGSLTDETAATWRSDRYDEDPASFRRGGESVQEMTLREARGYLAFLERAGLPSGASRAEYLRRFSFALTPLIVTLLSIALTGRFRKNMLLMSLLVSLVGATLYYVAQMISMLLAKNDAITPLAGAFAPIAIFALVSAGLLALRKV